MPQIVVHVMPKPELLDPQGKAITRALARNDFHVGEVRQGKRFEITVEGPITDQVKAEAQRIADEILSNSVIENVVLIEFTE